MSETCFDADYTPKVTVPIRRVGDRWEFFYGGDVPVKDGTIGANSDPNWTAIPTEPGH